VLLQQPVRAQQPARAQMQSAQAQAPPQRPTWAQGQQPARESVQGPGPAQEPARAQEPAQAQAWVQEQVGKTVRSHPYWKTLMGARVYTHQEKNAVVQRPWRTGGRRRTTSCTISKTRCNIHVVI
jgi:hypothetical protein